MKIILSFALAVVFAPYAQAQTSTIQECQIGDALSSVQVLADSDESNPLIQIKMVSLADDDAPRYLSAHASAQTLKRIQQGKEVALLMSEGQVDETQENVFGGASYKAGLVIFNQKSTKSTLISSKGVVYHTECTNL